MKKIASLLVLSICFSQCEPVILVWHGQSAANFILKNDTLEVSGVLGKKAYKRFNRLLQNQPKISTLVLLDVPGSINDEYNLKMGKRLHDAGLNTVLTSTSIIASGGVDLFLCGNERYVEAGAKIGVHSWIDGTINPNELSKIDSAHHLFLNFYNDIGVDTSFYWFTLQAAPADSMHWMTLDEIQRYDIGTK